MVEEADFVLQSSPDLRQLYPPLLPSTPLQAFGSALQIVFIEPGPGAGSHPLSIIVTRCAPTRRKHLTLHLVPTGGPGGGYAHLRALLQPEEADAGVPHSRTAVSPFVLGNNGRTTSSVRSR